MNSDLRAAGLLALSLSLVACESDADRARAAIRAGRAALEAERLDDAIAELERAVALDPSSRHALVLLARAELESGDAAAAVSALDRADALGDTNAYELGMRGHAELALEHWALAEAAFGRAYEADPSRTPLLGLRGDALAHLTERRADAIAAYRAAARADASATHVRIELARLLLDEEEASTTTRPCPEPVPGPDGRLVRERLDREGLPEGDAVESCLAAEGAPCAPRVEALQVLFTARLDAPEELRQRAADLEMARADHCWPDGALGYLVDTAGEAFFVRGTGHDPRVDEIIEARAREAGAD